MVSPARCIQQSNPCLGKEAPHVSHWCALPGATRARGAVLMACPGSMNVPCLPPSATRWLPWNAPRMPRGWLGSSRTGGVIMYHMTLHYYTTMSTTYYNRNYVLKQWRDKATKVRTWESKIEEISAWNVQVLLCFSGPKLWHLLNSTRDILVHLFWAHEVIMSQKAAWLRRCMTSNLRNLYPESHGSNNMTGQPQQPLDSAVGKFFSLSSGCSKQ